MCQLTKKKVNNYYYYIIIYYYYFPKVDFLPTGIKIVCDLYYNFFSLKMINNDDNRIGVLKFHFINYTCNNHNVHINQNVLSKIASKIVLLTS